jgi:bifunctional DNA-binding transcriptional regulator/antitoxin component of YhaV-PrlF toxin-antitoxin module
VVPLIAPAICWDADKENSQAKLTSPGEVSVPASVRTFLYQMPGSALVYSQDGNRIVLERATPHSTTEVHQALFAGGPPAGVAARSLAELKQGVKQAIRPCRPRPVAGR